MTETVSAVEVTFGSEARVRFKPSKADLGYVGSCTVTVRVVDVSSALIGRGMQRWQLLPNVRSDSSILNHLPKSSLKGNGPDPLGFRPGDMWRYLGIIGRNIGTRV